MFRIKIPPGPTLPKGVNVVVPKIDSLARERKTLALHHDSARQ
jgi:hypothetical protein